MKLILSAATVFILLAKESQVAAFSPSKNSQTVRFSSYASLTSDHRLSMTAEAETEMDYAAVNKLAYRELQSRCKDRGLAANGNTAALRCSLLEDLGLLKGDEDCDIVDDYVDASVVEVSQLFSETY